MSYPGILSDREIEALCSGCCPLLDPFVAQQSGKPSFGLGSFGYDIRLGRRVAVPSLGADGALDPVNVAEGQYSIVEGDVFSVPARSFVLGESVERFEMPDDVVGLVWGKSSYARCGLLVNVTPLEPGWRGILTLCLANLSGLPIRIHVGQGIAQVVFFRGLRPERTYGEKEAGGSYQDQDGVTPAR
jgi:dCTP deaminase